MRRAAWFSVAMVSMGLAVWAFLVGSFLTFAGYAVANFEGENASGLEILAGAGVTLGATIALLTAGVFALVHGARIESGLGIAASVVTAVVLMLAAWSLIG